MYFLCDLVEFGAVKQANKLKKRVFEIAEGRKLTDSEKLLRKINLSGNTMKELRDNNAISDIRAIRASKTDNIKSALNKNPAYYRMRGTYDRKIKSGEYNSSRGTKVKEMKPDSNNFTDVRKTNDKAASSTGYLGFRTDPYKGYGGMMEEPVDLIETGRKIRVKPRISYSSSITTSDFGFVMPRGYNTDKIRSSIALNRDGLKYVRGLEKKMFGLHPEVRDPRKLIRLAGVRSNLATQIKNKERILKGDS